jgi:predicted ribosomally synthesized peptide with SipW-like signal peptide
MRIRIQITRDDGSTVRVSSPQRRLRRSMVILLALGVVGLVGGLGSYAAFTSTTSNSGSSFAAGSVAIEDDDTSAMLSLANAKPGDTDSSCIKVKYTGSLSSTVKLYGTMTGSLPSYITLTVTRGTNSAPSFDSCTSFTADGTDYLGLGNGIIYQGSLASFPANYAAGILDPKPATPETWTTNEEHSYKFAVSLDDNNAAQTLTGTAPFTWEARKQ